MYESEVCLIESQWFYAMQTIVGWEGKSVLALSQRTPRETAERGRSCPNLVRFSIVKDSVTYIMIPWVLYHLHNRA